jgi:methionyl-tRNA formyltransferase
MRIVFFGTSKFAVKILQKLAASGNSVMAVVTQPDKKSGRSLKVTASPVKIEARKLRLPICQPANLGEKGFIDKLQGFEADFFVVVAFGNILARTMLEIPSICCLNVHASLLPKYRGAAPVSRALVNGEEKTGVTIIRMNEKMDAGDIVLQKELEIGPADAKETLDSRLADIGAALLIEAIESIRKGDAHFTPQNEREATFAPKLTKEDGRIDWNLDGASILNRIKGLKPWPGTYSFLDGRALKIISAEAKCDKGFSRFSPGEVIAADEEAGLVVRTGDGAISILELQLEGKKSMRAELFLRGYKIKPGAKLE